MLSRFNRRTIVRGSWMAALGFPPLPAPAASTPGPGVYTRVGYTPFINLTATYTINGGTLTWPEVKRAMEEASFYPVNLDELMEKVGARIAFLLGAEAAIVTSGCAAALTLATAGALAGTDPEKIQQLPDLTGLKSEVVIPRASRNAYDHAFRAVGIRMVEVDSLAALDRAVGPRTALLTLLGTGEKNSPIRLEHLVAAGRRVGAPVVVDAAAELPLTPNPYLSRGADLVAYSGGKILRGPQCAGLLLGRADLVRAAWANSSPHHAFGRMLKVGKEEIMGMLAAIELWKGGYDIESDYRTWRGWFAEIQRHLEPLDGVTTEVRPPAGASPFPVLWVEWDPHKFGLTAGELGRLLLEGPPRIMSHAEGPGHGFLIRPVSMKPGEAAVVGERLAALFHRHAGPRPAPQPLPPAVSLSGAWKVDLEFSVGRATHRLELSTQGAEISGTHHARLGRAPVRGSIRGSKVTLSSRLRYEGSTLVFDFEGSAAAGSITGTVSLGEYGAARFHATRES